MRMQRKRRADVAVNLSSMGDIAFLLIIFFVLAAQFMKESNIKYELPKEEDPEKVVTSPILVTIDEKGDIYFQGKLISVDEVESSVTTDLAKIEEKKDKVVHFKCDARQPRKIFEPVLIAISEAGGIIIPIGDKANE